MIGEHPAAAPAGAAMLPDMRDPERQLMVAHLPVSLQPAVAALWLLDEALAAIVAATQQPVVGQMRLSWWHHALCGLDDGNVARHPVLQSVAAHLLPAGVTGGDLAALVDGWEVLLEPGPLDEAMLRLHAEQRGGALFALVARVIAGEAAAPGVRAAGSGWALVDLACHSRDVDAGARAVALAASCFTPEAMARWPAALRPLGMIAALARFDASRGRWRRRRQGAPLRVATMVAHRLFGR